MLKSAETVSLIGTSPDLSLTSTTSSVTGEIPKREPVTINSEEEWRKFFTEQSNPNTNTTNKKETKREVSKDDNGANIFTARGEHKYNGNDIVGKVAEEVKTEISQSIGENTVKSIRLKEAKLPGRNNVVTPSVRIMLDDNKKAFNMATC
ncbi:hypothetical protein [Wolbachia endosymbiont of Ctenocephalides felis wCfeT]|uniref:hypothetical protein n=1 Tax=Wolbachia endosymbiont of Ctenocephalides felis wCfeT TaxID=2732593 RepID=UPI001582696E|nr:hypothetical protein [Wolbachia endosymbiont of Ctenocephalides felis wCfeT]